MQTDSGRMLAAALLLALAAALPAPAVTASAETRDFRFEVFLDGRHIGQHHFEVAGEAGGERVRSQAEFEFRLLFVTLYRYRHLADEVWEKGCLSGLTSSTDDNGRAFAIEAARHDEARLLLTRLKPDRTSTEVAAACPATFAYWDRERLRVGQLINAQTGDVSNARLIPEGDEVIDGIATLRYRLEADGLSDIYLWYRADDGAWWRLATRRDGRMLEYRTVADISA
jgi:hypothetical protein